MIRSATDYPQIEPCIPAPRRAGRTALLLILPVFSLLSRSVSQDDLIATNRYVSAHWDAGQDLATNDLRAVVQTRDGYVWVGSGAGLIRFDGVRFTVFNRRNTPQFLSDDVTSLAEDRSGRLWVSFLRGGVMVYERGRFTRPSQAGELTSTEVYYLFADSLGAICICSSRGVFRILGDRAAFVEGLADLPRSGCAAAGGTYYLAGGSITQCRDWTAVREVWKLPSGIGATCVCADSGGSLLAGTGTGLVRLRTAPEGRIEPALVSRLRQVLTIVPYGERGFLVGSLDNGVLSLERDELRSLPGFDVLRGGGRQVRRIAVDRDGGIWVTSPGGLYRFRKSFIRILGAESGITSEFAWTVHYARDRTLWVGGGDRGTYRISTTGVSLLKAPDGMPSDYVSAMYEAHDGSLWFGGMTGGLVRYHHGSFRKVDGYPDVGVFSITEDPAGGMWVGGSNGLHYLKGSSFVSQAADSLLGRMGKVRAVVPSADGTVWVVGGGKIHRLSGGALRSFGVTGEDAHHPIMCMYVDTGRVWAGTYGGGLFMLRDDSLTAVSPRSAELAPRILAIHEDSSGFLWINAERELHRVRKSELLRAVDDPDHPVRLWVYDHQDGLTNLDFSHVSSSSAQQLENGTLLYTSTNGIVVVKPVQETASNVAPPVYVEDLLADGVATDLSDRPELSAGTRRLEIRFTALQFDVPKRVRFKVKLVGLDPDWIELDGLTRSIVYTNPPPRNYTFQVEASTLAGYEGTREASISFSIAPYFFQTWWFRSGAGLLVVGLLIGVYRARMRSLHARTQALSLEIAQRALAEEQLRASLEEKTVMLKEIHHRVKNNLQVVSSLLSLQANTHRDRQLQREFNESQQRIRSMALIHEALYRSGNLARVAFKEYLETLVGHIVTSHHTVPVTVQVEGEETMLSVEQAIPAALIINELVTNSLKHAFDARVDGEIVVRINDAGEGTTELTVRDNGTGIPEGFEQRQAETLGMQLVATLATQLEGKMEFSSGGGTIARIRFKRD